MQQPVIDRSFSVFPAGSNGEFNLPRELSIVIHRGSGCQLWDTEGREFYDFSIGWGSVLVGHARDEVVAAVENQIRLGSNFSYVNDQSLQLGEELVRLSPACDRIRFCASGTEATMYCQRLARAYTNRPKILKFEGAYHGSNEAGVTSLFTTAHVDFPRPNPTSAGLAGVEERLLVAPFNDAQRAEQIISQHADELAAVIVEPLQRCVPPEAGFLEALRRVTREHNVLLIFDEVVTGFRLAYAGAQEYYGVVPDLVAYGKALGGGYPIGAFGGRGDVMELVCEDRLGKDDRYVWVASTLAGNPISCAAALAALGVLRQPGTYEQLHEQGQYLRQGMADVLERRGVTGRIIGDGPLAQVVFTDKPVRDYRSTSGGDSARGRRLMLELFRRGVFLNPMGTKLYLSLAHDEAVCDEFLARFDAALGESAV